ncbi:protein mono-ADP-ribosyltransferase PARP4 [Heteronotia binoei]|uniref:protein mono-ADP-ribosyltransferase PARP4 n=1 Tax=Heteronotia binoei TaxID=13085 RepID=UPI00292F0044|nr:protein mono-ADP-ribosyltransferase PARP4 [Heteronotia binoei]
MPEPIFTNCGFFLKLKKITIQEKNKLKDCIKGNGGQITFAINDKCTHVVTDDADALSSVHLKAIKKKQLPIVGVNFIWDSVKENRLLPPSKWEPLKALESAPDVKVVSVCEEDSQKVNVCAKTGLSCKTNHESESDDSNIDKLRWFSNNDKNIPYFPEDFEVAKYDVLEKGEVFKECVVVELQCALQCCDYPFRIRTHGMSEDVKVQWALIKTSEEARRVYEHCTEQLKKADFELSHDFPYYAEHLASTKLQEILVAEAISCGNLSEEVGVFVELLWAEALGFLKDLLHKPVTSISLNDVTKAEGVLLRAKEALFESRFPEELKTMIAEFYTIIPHKTGIDYNVCAKLLCDKQDLCQLIRDMLNVHEISMSHPNPSSLSKYRSLGCKIDVLDANSEEFSNIKQQVVQNNSSKCSVEVLQIYKVSRKTETAAFESSLGNVQTLLHGSTPSNFVGILSRGLLLPKMVAEELGIQRTDSGYLGCGIYFSDSISTSIRFSQPNKIDGTRLLVICDVALGRCWDTYYTDPFLTAAPSGYDSVHGICKAKDKDSIFQDDEFAVYRTSQVKIRYVVKFCLSDDKVNEFNPTIQSELEDQAPVPEHQSKPEDYKIPSQKMLDDIAAGLLDRSGNPIPLKDVHIKGRIIDFVAQVVVFQTYENTSDNPIEAKYVFPLDDTAAVCGFEAFIKGKHIIGEVKEKEVAHREYRDAVIRGDGAYLMDQDAPDIFTVSVGNLPPSTRVLIKITYITELAYDHGSLSFLLPAAVAPWQQDKALNENTQDTVTKVAVKQIGTKPGGFSLEMSVEMPFKIDYIDSWTHQLKIKKTDCKAVICTAKDSSLDVTGFAMEIGIGDAHLPRMWIEKHPDKETEACMLVFQPQFAALYEPSSSCGEIIICLDCSNSMAGPEMQQAKQIALCALNSCHGAPRLSVIKFGTSFVHFPFNPEKCTTDLTALEEFVLSATPSMGNTDLWKTLHYLSLLCPSKAKRNILLISDGHIENEAMTLQTVKENAQHTRIFTCGVGYAANRHMLRSLSQYGAGAFEYFDMKSKYNWERKIQCQTSRMYSPGCSAVSVKWQQFDVIKPELMYTPAQIQSLFDNERLLVYGFISHCTQATLNALIDNQELQTMVSTTDLQKITGTMLHKLAARAFIRDYEQGILHEDKTKHEMKKQQLKSLIIQLSLENSIVTQFTSFVAIERRDVDEDQVADTLNISELVAKEDVDILPYMQYQVEEPHPVFVNAYHPCMLSRLDEETDHSSTSVDSQVSVSDLRGQNFLKATEVSLDLLNLREQYPGLLPLPTARISRETAKQFSISFDSGPSISSPSTIPTSLGTVFGFSDAAPEVPDFPVQRMNLEGGYPTPLQGTSLSLTSEQISLPLKATGFGSAFTPASEDLPGTCEHGFVLQSGPPGALKTSFSAPSLPPAPPSTSVSVPAATSLGPIFSMQSARMKDSLPMPLLDQQLPPSSPQLLFSRPLFGSRPAPAAAPPFLPAPPSTSVSVPAVAISGPVFPMQRARMKGSLSVPLQHQLSPPSGPQLLPSRPLIGSCPVFAAAPPFLPAPPSTKVSVPAAAGSAPSFPMQRARMKDSIPVPLQYHQSPPSGPQLLPSRPCFGSRPAPAAPPPVVQFEPGSGIRTAADRAVPLPEDQWPLLSPASSFKKRLPAAFYSHYLEKAFTELESKELFRKQPEETVQNIIGKRKFKKKVCRMRVAEQPLSAVSWPQLSELQHQDGFWQLTAELGTILDLDVNDLVSVSLTKRGIQSLGPKGKEKLLQLIATLLVLQVIRFKQLEGITFKSLMKLNDSPPSRAFDAVKKAVEWAKRTNRQFPSICQRLELGKDWDFATKKLLGIKIMGTLANSK